jgi:phosphoribosylformylglycinamidine (FGAM) synthase-like enzyme
MGQGILPTPTIGGVGMLKDLAKMTTIRFKQAGDVILLVGGHGHHMGQSIYLREILGREEGAPPPVDLAKERKHGDLVRNLINQGQLAAVHDISDGGLLIAVIEMALPTGFGASLNKLDHIAMFAEDQSRYVITCKASEAAALLKYAEISRIGVVTAEPTLKIEGRIAISMAELREAHESWFPKFMKG